MYSQQLELLKSNLEFYAMDIEIFENFAVLLDYINTKPSVLLTSMSDCFKIGDFKNIRLQFAEKDIGKATFLVIEKDDTLIKTHNNLLLKLASDYYKNLQNTPNCGSVGICFDKHALKNLITICSSNPRLINKLYITAEILIDLNRYFSGAIDED